MHCWLQEHLLVSSLSKLDLFASVSQVGFFSDEISNVYFFVCSAKVSCFYCCSHFLFWWPAVLEVCCQLSIMDYHMVQAFSKIESLVEAQSSDHFNHFFFSQSDAQSSLLGCLEPLAWTCRCGVACPRSLRLVWMFRISAAGLVLRVNAPVHQYLSFLGRSDFT